MWEESSIHSRTTFSMHTVGRPSLIIVYGGAAAPPATVGMERGDLGYRNDRIGWEVSMRHDAWRPDGTGARPGATREGLIDVASVGSF